MYDMHIVSVISCMCTYVRAYKAQTNPRRKVTQTSLPFRAKRTDLRRSGDDDDDDHDDDDDDDVEVMLNVLRCQLIY